MEKPHVGNFRKRLVSREFQAGDILVACDNVNGLPPGYMGHSAIVIDPIHLIEAVDEKPFIRKDSIRQFLQDHPMHAHYRPFFQEWGQRAAMFSQMYLQTYMQNFWKGIQMPPFSLDLNIPLYDPWRSIYCSKLVWLAYYWGCHYPFHNDAMLFAPEDLDRVLSHDKNFILLFKHRDFSFKINA